MPALWLDELPQYGGRAGFQVGIGDNRIVSSTDVGGDNSRRRSSRRVDPLTFVMFFTEHQMRLFWRFWEDDLGGGNLPWWFPAQPRDICLTDGVGAILTDEAGAELVARDWWFVEWAKRQPPPVFQLRGLEYVATMTLGRIL